MWGLAAGTFSEGLPRRGAAAAVERACPPASRNGGKRSVNRGVSSIDNECEGPDDMLGVSRGAPEPDRVFHPAPNWPSSTPANRPTVTVLPILTIRGTR